MPVDGSVPVMVVFREEWNGKVAWVSTPDVARDWRWVHENSDFDIVAYRIVKEAS
jgi:hypothetical protein